MLGQGAPVGNSAQLIQVPGYVKTADNASLRVVVSKAFLEGIDANQPDLPTALECPWHRPGGNYFDCRRTMWAWVSFDVQAVSQFDQSVLLNTGGYAELSGFVGAWTYDAYTNADATVPFWSPLDFEFDPDFDEDNGGHATVNLQSPITIDIPLASVPTGKTFYLWVTAKAETFNHRQRESYLAAYFRDPQQSDGLAISYEGLEPIETPVEKPVPIAAVPAADCPTGPDPAAGTLQFEAATFEDPEVPGDGATVFVTRTGGSSGAVSALFTTIDGNALAGADYTAVTTQVLFADGESGRRAVRIPLVVDALAEPDKTLTVTLSDPKGCAALGTPSTAVLTIMDDDRPIVLTNFTIGGTVTGLVGTGLVLLEATGGEQITPTGGTFTFTRREPTGFDYQVRVMSQPTNPFQVCTVTNGTGTIADADVTNVMVDCVTVPTDGALDPGFGDGGKVTTGLTGGATAMALQADGKIVLVGGRILARYDTDGSPDQSFGTGGQVAIVFSGTADEGLGVTVQPDGMIVVVGTTGGGLESDFGVARYDTAGVPDPNFGTGGKVRTDFAGSVDRAYAVRIQTDNKIVVAGHAAIPSPIGGNNEFAVARYSSAGAPDMGFGTGGKVMTNIGGATDLAYAMALQSDGKIVVAGRVADGGGDDPDVGVVRYDTGGVPDESFGTHGIVRQNFTGKWDEASDIAIQPDGKIVVAVQAFVGTTFKLAAGRFKTDGHVDDTFGSGGLASIDFTAENDYARGLALQSDGNIVLVGQLSNLNVPDFGVVRLDAGGTPDSGFGDGGKLRVDFFGSFDGADCVAILPDGKIVVGGSARNGATTGLGLIRVLP